MTWVDGLPMEGCDSVRESLGGGQYLAVRAVPRSVGCRQRGVHLYVPNGLPAVLTPHAALELAAELMQAAMLLQPLDLVRDMQAKPGGGSDAAFDDEAALRQGGL